jgi:hypothetical protein
VESTVLVRAVRRPTRTQSSGGAPPGDRIAPNRRRNTFANHNVDTDIWQPLLVDSPSPAGNNNRDGDSVISDDQLQFTDQTSLDSQVAAAVQGDGPITADLSGVPSSPDTGRTEGNRPLTAPRTDLALSSRSLTAELTDDSWPLLANDKEVIALLRAALLTSPEDRPRSQQEEVSRGAAVDLESSEDSVLQESTHNSRGLTSGQVAERSETAPGRRLARAEAIEEEHEVSQFDDVTCFMFFNLLIHIDKQVRLFRFVRLQTDNFRLDSDKFPFAR